jgi:hypothetical protein
MILGLSVILTRIIHKIPSGEQALYGRGSTLRTTLSKIEGLPMGMCLEEIR